MAGKLKIKLVTPWKIVFEDDAEQLTVMTEDGEITILPNHVPLVSLLRAGEMRLRDGANETLIAVSTGVIEVRPNGEIYILAETAERADELDLQKIEEARKLAQDRLAEVRNQNEVAYADAAAMLERELARYKVAVKRKR